MGAGGGAISTFSCSKEIWTRGERWLWALGRALGFPTLELTGLDPRRRIPQGCGTVSVFPAMARPLYDVLGLGPFESASFHLPVLWRGVTSAAKVQACRDGGAEGEVVVGWVPLIRQSSVIPARWVAKISAHLSGLHALAGEAKIFVLRYGSLPRYSA